MGIIEKLFSSKANYEDIMCLNGMDMESKCYKEYKKNFNWLTELDGKVDEFIYWYYENMVKGSYTEFGEYRELKSIRDFIEKMAVWYELRYPEYEVNRLMHCCSQEEVDVNDVMFRNNKYINDLFDEKSDVNDLEWADFYSTSSFIKSLPCEEKNYLSKPKYDEIVYLGRIIFGPHLHLTSDGKVRLAENISHFTHSIIKDEELEGMNVKDVVKLFDEKGIELSSDNEIYSAIRNYDNQMYFKEKLLDSVMYRIIERGGNRIGPRRGFMFAKEFGRNIDIPMMYGIDFSDPGLRLFMNEYIKAGGSMDLKCYDGYFRMTDGERPEIFSIRDMFSYDSCYTDEEVKLHQKLVNILANQVDYDYLNREKVKQLRMERKLKKSRG